MSLRKLTAYIVVVELIGLGVFFAFLLGAAVTQGGSITITMTVFNEMWPEYVLMTILVAVAPYAFWYIDEQHLTSDE